MREDQIFSKIPLPIPPTDEQIAKARRVVCGNSESSNEAETLLRMLGLI